MKIKEDNERAGLPYEPEAKVWEEIKEKPYITRKKSYVVCIDTLG